MISRRKNFYLYRSRYVCLTAVWAFTFSMCYVKTIFESFSSVDEMSCVNRNYPNSAKFELELDGPMWFLFTRPCTPQRLQFRISNFIGVRHCFWAVLIHFSLSWGFTSFLLFRTFWWFDVLSFDVLSTGEQKISQSARFELAQKDPICFLVRSLNHSAMTSRRKNFYLYRSRYVCLTAVWAFTFSRCYVKTIFESFSSVDEMSCVNRNYPNSAKFELELDGPMWFLFTRPCTPQRLQFRISNFIGVRHCFWAVLIHFSLSWGFTSFLLFRTFWWFDVLSFDVLSTGEQKITQSARFELAQQDPIWFRVRRLKHSAMTAWRGSYFYLSGSSFVELLCELILSQDIT